MVSASPEGGNTGARARTRTWPTSRWRDAIEMSWCHNVPAPHLTVVYMGFIRLAGSEVEVRVDGQWWMRWLDPGDRRQKGRAPRRLGAVVDGASREPTRDLLPGRQHTAGSVLGCRAWKDRPADPTEWPSGVMFRGHRCGWTPPRPPSPRRDPYRGAAVRPTRLPTRRGARGTPVLPPTAGRGHRQRAGVVQTAVTSVSVASPTLKG
jgi:hypothetical protein